MNFDLVSAGGDEFALSTYLLQQSRNLILFNEINIKSQPPSLTLSTTLDEESRMRSQNKWEPAE